MGALPALRRAFICCLLLPLQAASQPADGESVARFDVFEYEVVGTSLISDLDVERAVLPYLGPTKSADDVESARSALEKAYRDAGYATVTVSIPEQKVDAGVVRLEVAEARVDRVRVTGARYYDQDRILAEAPAIVEGAVPHFPAIQEDIGRLNRMPGRRVTPVLKAGRLPDTTDIELTVEDQPPFGGSVELNNYHSPNTEPLRLTASVRYDNLFQRLHAATLQYQVSPQDPTQVEAITGSYLVPLDRPGDFLSFYGARSKSEVAVLSTTNALGNGYVLGMRWIARLRGGEGIDQGLSLGVEYKDFKDTLVQPGLPPADTPIRYMPFSIGFNRTQSDGSGQWGLATGLVWSFRGLGSDDADFNEKRFLGRSNFIVWKWDLQRTQSLGSLGSLFAGFDGQLASQALVSNEQYAAGGADSVRGYLQAEALGDSAYRGTLEYRGPSLAGAWAPWLKELTPQAFLEGARLLRKDALPAEQTRATLSSAGLGLRMRGPDGLNLRMDLAWPFKDTQQGTEPVTRAGTPRLQFSTAFNF